MFLFSTFCVNWQVFYICISLFKNNNSLVSFEFYLRYLLVLKSLSENQLITYIYIMQSEVRVLVVFIACLEYEFLPFAKYFKSLIFSNKANVCYKYNKMHLTFINDSIFFRINYISFFKNRPNRLICSKFFSIYTRFF